MSAYTIKQTEPDLFALIHRETGRTMLQTSEKEMQHYAEMFGIKMPREKCKHEHDDS